MENSALTALFLRQTDANEAEKFLKFHFRNLTTKSVRRRCFKVVIAATASVSLMFNGAWENCSPFIIRTKWSTFL
ncbi:CLUMA_CG005833, isoform A [Clunio marinus]|uniref:CLUMA_CG005833, isoform A n=1 Tax=Clunio marinus TaxID=568069 RepID=A0A1J1I083_9DIPT|nr:CLUMA_CG005833, isoform A [Clunio marinus]